MLIVGALLSTSNNNVKIILMNLSGLQIFAFITFFVIYQQTPEYSYSLFNYTYSMDFFVYIFKLFVILFLIFVIYISIHYFYLERVFFFEYFFFISLFCMSLFGLVSASDFILFYLMIELQALILYTLASFKRYNIFSAEAGLKYFVLGAFSSGLLLFGISLFYGFTGLTNFYDLKYLLLVFSESAVIAGLQEAFIFILAAFLFKLGAAPFHL